MKKESITDKMDRFIVNFFKLCIIGVLLGMLFGLLNLI